MPQVQFNVVPTPQVPFNMIPVQVQLNFANEFPNMQPVTIDSYYDPFSSYSLFHHDKKFGRVEITSKFSAKLGSMKGVPDFSYFRHPCVSVASNSSGVGKFSAQSEFQKPDISDTDKSTEDKSTEDNSNEIEVCLKEILKLQTSIEI